MGKKQSSLLPYIISFVPSCPSLSFSMCMLSLRYEADICVPVISLS